MGRLIQPPFIVKADPMTPAIRVRLVALHEACFPGIEPMNWAGDWWVAVLGREYLGFAGLWPSARTANAGYLCRCGVAPKARGNGLQRKFIRARERHARALGMTLLVTDTIQDNAHSGNNLIECGYRMFNPPDRWATEDAIYWRRFLTTGVA